MRHDVAKTCDNRGSNFEDAALCGGCNTNEPLLGSNGTALIEA